MKPLKGWFNNFFLSSLCPSCGGEELIEDRKAVVRLRWLFGTAVYLSIASFFLWVLSFSSIHLSPHMRDKHIVEKIFFFASPTVWKNYVLGITGGFFNILRKASTLEEKVFIFFNFGVIISSSAGLVMSLATIYSSYYKDCKKLRIMCFPFCFPALGWIFAVFILIYFQLSHNKQKIRDWSHKYQWLGADIRNYFEFEDARAAKKAAFKPKTRDFLVIKKEPKKFINFLNKWEECALKHSP